MYKLPLLTLLLLMIASCGGQHDSDPDHTVEEIFLDQDGEKPMDLSTWLAASPRNQIHILSRPEAARAISAARAHRVDLLALPSADVDPHWTQLIIADISTAVDLSGLRSELEAIETISDTAISIGNKWLIWEEANADEEP